MPAVMMSAMLRGLRKDKPQVAEDQEKCARKQDGCFAPLDVFLHRGRLVSDYITRNGHKSFVGDTLLAWGGRN